MFLPLEYFGAFPGRPKYSILDWLLALEKMDKPDLYFYAPLDNAGAQIRLLKVVFDVKLAMGHENGSVLAGTMRSYYLPKSTLSRAQRVVRSFQLPAFFALSYVWGDPTRTHEVLVDGKRLKITENLYNAIRDLQRDAIGEIYLWADAICINQDDTTEKSAQILLMREIYHSAATVKIWLGMSTPEGKRCMGFISQLAGEYYDGNRPPRDEDSEEKGAKALLKPVGAIVNAGYGFGQAMTEIGDIIEPGGRDDKAVLVLDTDGDQKIIERFLKWRPSSRKLKKVEGENFAEIANLIDSIFIEQCVWFGRMWVVQELGVAGDVDIVYDGYGIRWEDFLRTVYYLHYTCKFPVPHIQKLTGLEKIRMGWNDRKRLPLYDLIRVCQYRQSSNPRDRVYSLFGLMGDKMNNLLQPDYTEPVGEVYALTTQHFIKESESLDSICGWQTEERGDIPSWIPDYSLDQTLTATPLVVNFGRESLFSASGYDHRGKYVLDASAGNDWQYLRTRGLIIDSVTKVSSSTSGDAELHAIENTWKSTILAAGHLLQGYTEDLEPSLNSISAVVERYSKFWEKSARSYTLNSYKIESLSIEECLSQVAEFEFNMSDKGNMDIIKAYLQTLLCGRGTTKSRLSDKDIQAIIDLTIPDAPTEQQNDAIRLICKAFESGMKNRVVGVTNNGYFGALPKQAKEGDLVCVLFGCTVPVVLRKHDGSNSYMFVGECYLHGFMDGKAIVLQVKKEIEEQEFILR
jgi:hypothetical protein